MGKKTFVILVLVLVVCVLGLIVANKYWGKPNEVQIPKTGLVVLSPIADQEVSSPIKVTGYTNGDGWIGFEGQVGSVKLVVDGVVLAQTPLTAKGDWMTTSPIDFEANLEFQLIGNKTGSLIFANENPSGLAEKDKTFTLPIKVSGYTGEATVVKVYFGKNTADSTCNVVFATNRTIPATEAIARAALQELLNGPTDNEKTQGFFTSINQDVKIQSLTIANGVAKVDFDDQLEFQTGGSCRVSAIRSQITQTLKQFSTVKDVIISINGRTEDILQP